MKRKLTNQEIENEAIKFVMKKYKNAKPADKGSGYDLKIGNRIIEVKGTASDKVGQNIFLSRKQEYNAWEKNQKRYWIYRVINVGKPNCEVIPIPAKDMKPIPDPRWRVKI